MRTWLSSWNRAIHTNIHATCLNAIMATHNRLAQICMRALRTNTLHCHQLSGDLRHQAMPYLIADCLAGEKGPQGNPVMKGFCYICA